MHLFVLRLLGCFVFMSIFSNCYEKASVSGNHQASNDTLQDNSQLLGNTVQTSNSNEASPLPGVGGGSVPGPGAMQIYTTSGSYQPLIAKVYSGNILLVSDGNNLGLCGSSMQIDVSDIIVDNYISAALKALLLSRSDLLKALEDKAICHWQVPPKNSSYFPLDCSGNSCKHDTMPLPSYPTILVSSADEGIVGSEDKIVWPNIVLQHYYNVFGYNLYESFKDTTLVGNALGNIASCSHVDFNTLAINAGSVDSIMGNLKSMRTVVLVVDGPNSLPSVMAKCADGLPCPQITPAKSVPRYALYLQGNANGQVTFQYLDTNEKTTAFYKDLVISYISAVP